MHGNAVLSLVFSYYDLPKILKPEAFQHFRDVHITRGAATIQKSELIACMAAKFAGKCRSRKLWNLLQRNGDLTAEAFRPIVEVLLTHYVSRAPFLSVVSLLVRHP